MDLGRPAEASDRVQGRRRHDRRRRRASIGHDGTVYIATAAGAAAQSSTLFALEPKTLKQKGAAQGRRRRFSSSPLVFTLERQGCRAGRRRRQDCSCSIRHHSPAVRSRPVPPFGTPRVRDRLARELDRRGRRPLDRRRLAARHRHVQADGARREAGVRDGLDVARTIAAPLPPLVVNGVLFAASSGTRAAAECAVSRSMRRPGSSCGRAAAPSPRPFAAACRPAAAPCSCPASDSTLYAFGFEIEK